MTEIVDKHEVLGRMAGAKLDLGCGARKRGPEYIGIDVMDHDDVDVVGDVFDVLRRISNSSVSHVFSSHFMEHIERVDLLIEEIGRVLIAGGRLETIVPHFSNPYYYSDVTHKTSFGLYSMSYFVEAAPFKHQVPLYAHPPVFRLDEVDLVFKAPRPFYGRYALNKVIQPIVNFSRATQEFYEGILASWFSCYELRFLMTRLQM